MESRYRALERDYYNVLSRIYQRVVHGKSTRSKIPRAELPYLIEMETRKNLSPKKNCILSGISGSGKTTITAHLEKMGYRRLRNVTTRERRQDEKDSDYIFIDPATFRKWKSRGLVFHPHRRNNSWHGILKADLQKFLRGKSKYFADKSVASALEIDETFDITPKTTFVYILAPNFGELHLRISRRGDLKPKEVLDRFKEEIADMRKATALPYAYLVNNSRQRLRRLLASRF